MDIKIPSGPSENGTIDAAKDATEAAESAPETADVSNIEAAAVDSVSAIAEQVAKGEIGQAQAVEQILNDILDSKMVGAAPEELKQELGEVLKSLLETDPYLKSLTAAIGPSKSD